MDAHSVKAVPILAESPPACGFGQPFPEPLHRAYTAGEKARMLEGSRETAEQWNIDPQSVVNFAGISFC
jgi:hypothetical protein